MASWSIEPDFQLREDLHRRFGDLVRTGGSFLATNVFTENMYYDLGPGLVFRLHLQMQRWRYMGLEIRSQKHPSVICCGQKYQ